MSYEVGRRLAGFLQESKCIEESNRMLHWTVTFLILALVAAVLGFSSLAGGAAAIGQALFFIFLFLLVVSALTRILRDHDT